MCGLLPDSPHRGDPRGHVSQMDERPPPTQDCDNKLGVGEATESSGFAGCQSQRNFLGCMRFMVEGIAPILQIGTLRLREAQVTQLAGSAQMQRPMRPTPPPALQKLMGHDRIRPDHDDIGQGVHGVPWKQEGQSQGSGGASQS